MAYTIIRKLPSLDNLMQQFPLSAQAKSFITSDRYEIQRILEGHDPRLLIVIGPCSAWPSPAVLEYAKRLKILSEKYKDQLKLVMRVYMQKPRTKTGWLGPIKQPEPLLEPDIKGGLYYARELMVKIVEMGLPIADEALFSLTNSYFADLLAWVAIGARSSENQEHRIRASAMDCPVGIKNPTSGSIEFGVNGVVVAQQPHRLILGNYEVASLGNYHTHLVLRGGNGKPNFSLKHLQIAYDCLMANKVHNPSVVIDVSHENSIIDGVKQPLSQPQNAFNILEQIQLYPHLTKLVKGFMFESFIKEGSQKIAKGMDMDGLSITDACIGWEQTEDLLANLAKFHKV